MQTLESCQNLCDCVIFIKKLLSLSLHRRVFLGVTGIIVHVMSKERDYSKRKDGLLANCFPGKSDFYLLLALQCSYGMLDKASKPGISARLLFSFVFWIPNFGSEMQKKCLFAVVAEVSRSYFPKRQNAVSC